MTMLKQLSELEDYGIDFAGLIFYENSPRFVMKSGLTPAMLKKEGLKLKKVGVFVNEPAEKLLKTVEEWKLDLVQLHGDESPQYCELISNHVETVKAFRIGKDDDITYKIQTYQDAVDLYLFDTLGQQLGGTGEKFDWNLLLTSSILKPFFLSGGIDPDDNDAIRKLSEKSNSLYALDINSKFEIAPGNKDINKIKEFILKIKNIQ